MKALLKALFLFAFLQNFALAGDANQPCQDGSQHSTEQMRAVLRDLNECGHLFSIRHQDGEVVCFSGWPNDPNATNKYCVLFTNGVLSRIVVAPALRKQRGKDINGNDTLLDVQPDVYPESYIRGVLAATNTIPWSMVRKLETVEPERSPHIDWGLTAAFLAVKIACTPFAENACGDAPILSDKEIIAIMDPLGIPLGCSREALEERIGVPKYTRKTDLPDLLYYYGQPPKSIYNEPRCWVGILYNSNTVERILTHELLEDP